MVIAGSNERKSENDEDQDPHIVTDAAIPDIDRNDDPYRIGEERILTKKNGEGGVRCGERNKEGTSGAFLPILRRILILVCRYLIKLSMMTRRRR